MLFTDANYIHAETALRNAWHEYCGLTAAAAPEEDAGGSDACILPPAAIEAQADAAAKELNALNTAYKEGPGALQNLSLMQLRMLGKQHGISVKRSVTEQIALLDAAEPGVEHSDLAGSALLAKLKQHHINVLRNKDDFIKLLTAKWEAEHHQAAIQEIVDSASPPPSGGLHDMTVEQLKELAQQKGVSLSILKQDVIDKLDEIEPSVDHSSLSGAELKEQQIALFGKHPLKNKEMLIKALEQAAGQEMAQQAKQAAEQAAVQEAKKSIEDAIQSVMIPSDPADWKSFVEQAAAVSNAMQSGTGLLNEAELQSQAALWGTKLEAFKQTLQGMTAKQLQLVGKATGIKHWNWIAKQDMIVLMTEPNTAVTDAIMAKYAASAKANNEKYSKKASKAAKKQPKQPSPAITKATNEWAALDASWAESRGNPKNFAFEKDASELGGAHPKEFWLDQGGERWLFKPSGESFLAHAEEMAYRLGRTVDPEAIEVRVISLQGRIGTIQKMKTGLASPHDLQWLLHQDGFPLQKPLVEQLQREHVIDWFISNHDTHAKQFIILDNGRLLGIDKGQAGKHLGRSDEKLSIGYNPNANHGSLQSIYDRMFSAAKAGKLTIDPEVALPFIEAIERMTDADYESIMRAYGEPLHRGDDLRTRQFLDLCLARKRRIRADFESFYADVTNTPGFRFGAKQPSPESPERERFRRAVSEIPDVGFQGKALKIDSDQFEDQTLLAWQQYGKDGSVETVLAGKLHGEANRTIMEALGVAPPVDGKIPTTPEQIEHQKHVFQSQQFFNDILPAVKTISYHQKKGDTDFNKDKIDKAIGAKPALLKLHKSGDAQMKNMAGHYLQMLEIIEAKNANPSAAWDSGSVWSAFDLGPMPKSKAETKPTGPVLYRTNKGEELRQVKNGQLHVVNDSASLSDMVPVSGGEVIHADIGDGISLSFRPRDTGGPFAVQSAFRIKIKKPPTPENIQDALDRVGKFTGLNTRLATEQDEELLYLTKLGHLRRDDMAHQYLGNGIEVFADASHKPNPLVNQTPRWKQMMDALDKRQASTAERVAALEEFWSKELGFDVRSMAYDPKGKESTAHLDKAKSGGRDRQLRPDIAVEEIEKKMAGHTVYHSTAGVSDDSGTQKMLNFFAAALPNNGMLISTTEKMRIGVPVSGASPESDMETGGAAYTFTRIRKKSKTPKPGLYFKVRLLARMDAISYAGDEFGKTREGNVEKKRLVGIDGWKVASKSSSNETIFKDGISLLDELDMVVAGSKHYRDAVVEEFKRHGITHLNDGRKVEDIVVAK